MAGPRVIILGPADSGKSSLTRMLLNWGVRCGFEPMFVDLDVGEWFAVRGAEEEARALRERNCPYKFTKYHF